MDQGKAILLCCLDDRLEDSPNGHNLIEEFSLGLGLKILPVKRAGGVQDLVRPPQGMKGYKESILRDIKVRRDHHGGTAGIVLLNHEDCKAYPNFASPLEERKAHLNDLRCASQILKIALSETRIRMFFAELEPGTPNFVVREVPHL